MSLTCTFRILFIFSLGVSVIHSIFAALLIQLVRWMSGWNQRFAKPSYGLKLVPRVRIPPSPQESRTRNIEFWTPKLSLLNVRPLFDVHHSVFPVRLAQSDERQRGGLVRCSKNTLTPFECPFDLHFALLFFLKLSQNRDYEPPCLLLLPNF